jgi:pimeloyl-ACP methyl ester carboxylesterase
MYVLCCNIACFIYHWKIYRNQSFGDYVGGGGGGGAPVTLEVLDGRDYWRNGQFTTNTEVLADPSLGQPMNGAAADGEARLLLRARTTQPGSVTFSIPAGDGELIHYQGASSGSSVTVQTVPVNGEHGLIQHMAFAIYRATEQFPRAGHAEDESVARRDIPLKIIWPDGVSYSIQMVVLERPPVVLIHGWRGNTETWKEFIKLLTANARIPELQKLLTVADYAKTSEDAFSVNASVPRESVGRARGEFRQRRIAVAQADVIGHSMGGILSRIWAGDPEYRRWANFGAGDFNKLITMDSPHQGSPLAKALYPNSVRHSNCH